MKNTIKRLSALLLVLALSGCAYYQNVRATHDAEKQAYFQNSKNSLMLLIESDQGWGGVNKINCNFSGIGLGQGSTGFSGENHTPFVTVTSFDQTIREANSQSKEERQKTKLQLAANPYIMSMTCQLQNPDCSHLRAEAYFDGKKISSDETFSQYGLVSLSFHVPLAESIQD
ncbi:MAG TPA: hypothetical protein PKV84_05945 [Candidatus Omnitrophota bacterium]|nr:hypothetical protein [Candidatus Omnitrophota bacterium]